MKERYAVSVALTYEDVEQLMKSILKEKIDPEYSNYDFKVKYIIANNERPEIIVNFETR